MAEKDDLPKEEGEIEFKNAYGKTVVFCCTYVDHFLHQMLCWFGLRVLCMKGFNCMEEVRCFADALIKKKCYCQNLDSGKTS